MDKNIVFVINTSEITAGTRGASLGPNAIMTAARKKGSFIFGEHPTEKLECVNDLLDKASPHQYAKRIDGLVNVYEMLDSKVSSLLMNNKFPLILAADHGSAGGTIAGIKSAFPNKRLGVVWIDAHADIHTPFTTPSGNMHGMPLATALGIDNLECKTNEVPQDTLSFWNQLKHIGGISPKISSEDLVYIAVRDTEEQEDTVLSRLNIRNHKVADVRTKGMSEILKAIDEQLKDCDCIYVSFDVDSMDPDLTSHGTGTPVKDGLTPEEAKEILTHFAKMDKTVCMEIVEVNPCLDEKKNTMAEITLDLVESITETLKK
ncbi:Arginase [Flavobacterium limnosediminis JC2902]|uniref:Arginase n=1 Tax=Flavobacterium limnosediminis JC2902 TaxID=1341181 RepID=V6SM24_9FLAO|nr:arginase [Flavobacterium limnosediminis]ESU27287.1 Arginase [Flavobacterium limnosediminis JC2902]